jgi:hypothetical protein
MQVFLLVTWVFVSGTRFEAHSYQVTFSSKENCQMAQRALTEEALGAVRDHKSSGLNPYVMTVCATK